MKEEKTRSSHEEVYEVVWPSGRIAAGPTLTANPPITDLNGKTIGEVWNHAGRGDEMFPVIREGLQRRFPDVKFVDYQAFGNTHGPEENAVVAALPELLRQHGVDAVISAAGV